ncbi:hypothetical protein CSUI_001775, partial [Cystoisospora suis]
FSLSSCTVGFPISVFLSREREIGKQSRLFSYTPALVLVALTVAIHVPVSSCRHGSHCLLLQEHQLRPGFQEPRIFQWHRAVSTWGNPVFRLATSDSSLIAPPPTTCSTASKGSPRRVGNGVGKGVPQEVPQDIVLHDITYTKRGKMSDSRITTSRDPKEAPAN